MKLLNEQGWSDTVRTQNGKRAEERRRMLQDIPVVSVLTDCQLELTTGGDACGTISGKNVSVAGCVHVSGLVGYPG